MTDTTINQIKKNSCNENESNSKIIIMEKTRSSVDAENALLNNTERGSITKYHFKTSDLEKLEQIEKCSPVKRRDDSKILDDDILEKIELMRGLKSKKIRNSLNYGNNTSKLFNLRDRHNSSNYVLKSKLSSSNSISNFKDSFSVDDTTLNNSIFNHNVLSNTDINNSNSFKKLAKIKEKDKDNEDKKNKGLIITEEIEENSHDDEKSNKEVNNKKIKKVSFKKMRKKPKRSSSNIEKNIAVFSDVIESDADSEEEVVKEDVKRVNNKYLSKLLIEKIENSKNNIPISPISKNNVNFTLNTTNIYINKSPIETKSKNDKHIKEDIANQLQKLLLNASLSKDLSKYFNSSINSIENNSECQLNIESILKQWQYGEMLTKSKLKTSPLKCKRNSKSVTSKLAKKYYEGDDIKQIKTEDLKSKAKESSFAIKLIEISPSKKSKLKANEDESEPNKEDSSNQKVNKITEEAANDVLLKIKSDYLTEEETFIRFNKRGWICIYCANFNFETRQGCNRCKNSKNSRKKYFDNYTGQYVETTKELSANKNKYIQGNNSFNPKNQINYPFNNSPDIKNHNERVMKPPVSKNTSCAKTLSYKNLDNQQSNLNIGVSEGTNYQINTQKSIINSNSTNIISHVPSSFQNQQFYPNQFRPYSQFNQQFNSYIPQPQQPLDINYNFNCNNNSIRPNFNNINNINNYYQAPQYGNYNPYFPQKDQFFMMNNLYQNQNNQMYNSQPTYPQMNYNQYSNQRGNK